MSRGSPMPRRVPKSMGHELVLLILAALALVWLMTSILVAPAHGATSPSDPDQPPGLASGGSPPLAPVRAPQPAPRLPAAAEGTTDFDVIGGDDVIVSAETYLHSETRQPLAFASDGTLFTVVWVMESVTLSYLRVMRSTDAGRSWQAWGTLGGEAGARYDQPALSVAEGDQDRLFLAYRYSAGGSVGQVRVAWSPLTGASPAWTVATALAQADVNFGDPSLDSDAINVASYTLFLTATGLDADGGDVWFTRSATFGAGWEPGYKIANMTMATRDYGLAQVRYGWNGFVHCVFQFSTDDGSADDAVRYRRASNRAAGGVADWQPIVYLTANNDGRNEQTPSVAAAYGNMWMAIGWEVIRTDGLMIGAGVWGSSDAGATWPAAYQDSLNGVHFFALKALPGVEGFIGAGMSSSEDYGVTRAPNNAPWAWTPLQPLADRSYFDGYANAMRRNFDYDPTHGDRIGMVWPRELAGSGADTVFFDAEWHRDPGWPNLEAGMPLALPAGVVSPPAICELDGDPQSEIVFGDANGDVQVRNHDGSLLAGWPRNIGAFGHDSPIAIGDLNGDGRNEVVAGNSTGVVYAWRNDGTPLAGWPVTTGTGAPAYVSLGALLPGSPHQVVIASGTRFEVRLLDGSLAPGWPSYKVAAVAGPAAIGDVDGDGANEVVELFGGFMNVQSAAGTTRWYRNLTSAGKQFASAPTLGDLDLDGNLEITGPTLQGDVYVFHHDGTDKTGWPWHDGTSYSITSVALAHIWAGFEPELAFAIEDAAAPHLHALMSDGSSIGSWPNSTGDGWFLRGMPVMDVTPGPPYYWMVIAGSRCGLGYAWQNNGALVPGWPKELNGRSTVSPASGDVDADGRLEVVFTTEADPRLVVVDLGTPVYRNGAMLRSWWPMAGYNPERQGCLACEPDAVTQVLPGDPDLPISVQFAVPRPNPARGSSELAFALPAPAAVRLDVLDVQGRLVRSLVRDELPAGAHAAAWDGRDGHGSAVAAGVYYARLRLAGPAGTAELVRRVVRLP